MPSAYLYSVILFGQLVFASTPLFIKIALEHFDPFTLGLVRFSISIILLNLFLLIQGKRIIPQRQDWPWILLLGFLAIPLNQGFLFYGLQFTTPGHSALIYGMTPMLVTIFAIPILKERLSILKAIGILIALGGVIVVLSDRNITLEPDFVIGDIIIFIGMFGWALYTVFGKKLVKKLGSILAVTYTMTLGTLLFIPIGAYNTATFDFFSPSLRSWFALLFIAVVTSGIAYPLWYWALKYLEASKLSAFIYTQPIIAAILSHIFLSEELTINFIVGGITVISGVIITEKG